MPSKKRWIWDLYPLATDSWGAWELEDDEQLPDHRVYMRRYKGEGYLGPALSITLIYGLMERGVVKPDDFAVREGYVPTADDVALLKRLYPDADPYKPNWYTVKADLVAAGYAAAQLDKSEAPVLLNLLGKAMQSTPKRSGRRKADYATQQHEAELATNWERARDAGTYKGEFAREKGMKIADLNRLLKWVAARKKSLQ